MAGRVLLNSAGLKVSKPGVEVLATGPGGLQFSSDWSAFGLYTAGSHVLGWSVPQTNAGRHDSFIPFGKTFQTPPAVWFYRHASSGRTPVGNAGGFTLWIGASDNDRLGVVAQVGLTGITVTGFYRKPTNGTPQPQVAFDYYVFEYNL